MQIEALKRPHSSNELEVPPRLESKIKNIALEKLKVNSDNGFISLVDWKIFKHIDYPQFVFKLYIGYSQKDTRFEHMEKRYENSILAKQICDAHNLNLLIVPKAKKYTFENGRRMGIVVLEECVDINSTDSGQRELYDKHQNDLNETVRQLVDFVAKTGFYDINPRNVPIVNEVLGFQGSRRVALVDLEFMDRNKELSGFSGLMNCLFSEKQLDLVAEAANLDKRERLREIATYRKLQRHYQDKGLKTGKEPLQVDLASLGLNLETTGISKEMTIMGLKYKNTKLREVAAVMLQEINSLIQNKNDQESIIGKRNICLNTNQVPLNNYLYSPFKDTEGEGEYWMDQIAIALVDKGHVYQLIKRTGNGIYLQI